VCDSIHGLFHHVLRISLLSFFMVIPGAFENTAMAETHIPGAGGRPFSEGGAYGGATSGIGPCSPISNASNVANPSFALPINPVAPTPQQPAAQPAATPATTGGNENQATASNGQGDAARGLNTHGGSCNSCHKADKYDFAAQLDAVEQGRMPKGKTLAEAEKADLIAFLKSKTAQ
jgi:mono/diheme cytochrome c family protein